MPFERSKDILSHIQGTHWVPKKDPQRGVRKGTSFWDTYKSYNFLHFTFNWIEGDLHPWKHQTNDYSILRFSSWQNSFTTPACQEAHGASHAWLEVLTPTAAAFQDRRFAGSASAKQNRRWGCQGMVMVFLFIPSDSLRNTALCQERTHQHATRCFQSSNLILRELYRVIIYNIFKFKCTSRLTVHIPFQVHQVGTKKKDCISEALKIHWVLSAKLTPLPVNLSGRLLVQLKMGDF